MSASRIYRNAAGESGTGFYSAAPPTDLGSEGVEFIHYRAEGIDGVRQASGEESDGVGVVLNSEVSDRTAVTVKRSDDEFELRTSDRDVILSHVDSPSVGDSAAATAGVGEPIVGAASGVASFGAPDADPHTDVTTPDGGLVQARCSCGWLCGIMHRLGDSEYRRRSAVLLARGDFDHHHEQVVAW